MQSVFKDHFLIFLLHPPPPSTSASTRRRPCQEEYSSPELSPDGEAAHQPAASVLGQPIIAQPNNVESVVTEQPTELTNLSEAAQTATYGLES
ncbi:hypothetical protein LSH36_275g07005 [Paralvinella palmiformis]|uniref:Uncharacterized protein n=1 Tax=Paralvinella palmiformis TaxID=53620 RepID=A0AAD9JKL0_9ANNE|nr:hypothetical protein LSH36_275g07005 [Paralvinella palmiformis]